MQVRSAVTGVVVDGCGGRGVISNCISCGVYNVEEVEGIEIQS